MLMSSIEGFLDQLFKKPPFVTLCLLAINLIAFSLTTRREALEFFGLRATSVESGALWQPVTAMFLHFDATHLMLNEYGVVILGMPVELVFGKAKTAYLYLSTGIVGNVVSYFILPSYVLTAGASGAVFGLMGADIAMTLVKKTRPTGRSLGATLLYALVTFVRSMGPQINVVAHLAGLCFGVFAGFVLAKYSSDT